MAFELSRVDRLTKTYDLAARFPDLDGPFTAAEVALLPPRSGPNAATVWYAASVAGGIATVLFAGPDADSTGAVVVPASADLWLKVTDAPETDAKKIERITVIGGGAVLAVPTGVPVVSVNGHLGGTITLDADDVGALATGAGAGGALSGSYPNPGLNETTVDTVVAGKVGTVGSATAVALRAVAAPVRQVDIRRFLDPGQALPNDGTTDSSALLQEAVDWVNANLATYGPQQVYLPAGRYRLNTGITWKTGVGLSGAGRLETALVPVGRVCAINGWQASTVTWDGSTYDDCHFTDLTIDCSQQTHTGYDFSIKGMFIQHMKRARFERVRIINSWATGFGVDFLEDSWFVDCYATNAGRGVPSSRFGTGAGFGIGMGSSATESVTLINCVSIGNYTSGFFFEHLDRTEALYYSRGAKMVGCHASGNWQGVLDAGARELLATGCTFVGNSYAGFLLRGTGTGLQGGIDGVLSACTISGNGASSGAGVVIEDSSAGGYTLSACQVLANTGPGIWAKSTSKVGPGFKVRGGSVSNNSGAGIFFETTQTAVSLVIDGAELEGNGGDGINLSCALAEPSIRGNRARGNVGRGLALRGTTLYSSRPRILSNDFTGNTGGAPLYEHTIDDSTNITGNVVDAVTTVQNLMPNPTYETNSTGATSLNATLTRPASTPGWSGSFLLRGTSTAAAAGFGVISTTATVVAGQVVTGSLYIRAVAGRKVYPTLNLGPGGGQIFGPKVIATGGWQRVFITGVILTGKTTCRIAAYVDTDAAITIGEILDTDAAMITTGTKLWDYFDGSSAGAVWDGTANASTSTKTL